VSDLNTEVRAYELPEQSARMLEAYGDGLMARECREGTATLRAALEQAGRALEHVLCSQVIQHPLPWRVESDWGEEVRASDGYCIAKCASDAESIIARAEALASSPGAPVG
jgi:hypothetical protein